MNLTELKKSLTKLVSRERKGKKIKSKKIAKVLDGLKIKEKRFRKALDKEKSNKVRKELNLKLKVVRAQSNKARKLLKQLED
ncbi:MAG: hypothetical protein OER96_01405 [Gammaproteobacteria bacterium]|nr:hypothetical protein [Gammaproteobacteria bacterium]